MTLCMLSSSILWIYVLLCWETHICLEERMMFRPKKTVPQVCVSYASSFLFEGRKYLLSFSVFLTTAPHPPLPKNLAAEAPTIIEKIWCFFSAFLGSVISLVGSVIILVLFSGRCWWWWFLCYTFCFLALSSSMNFISFINYLALI